MSVGSRKKYKCNVPGCESVYIENCTKNKHFFALPINVEKRQKWLEILNFTIDENRKSYRICEEHFTLNQFSNTMKTRLLKYAVPNANLPSNAELPDNCEETENNEPPFTMASNQTATNEKDPPFTVASNQTATKEKDPPIRVASNQTATKEEDICRVCLYTGNFLSLLDNGHVQKLRKITKLKIKMNDKYPKYICDSCVKTMVLSNAFIDELTTSNEYLNNLLRDSENENLIDHTYSNQIDDIENVFGKSCRICLGMGKMQSITNQIKSLKKVTDINFSTNDKLPKQICCNCFDRLKKTVFFIEKCEITEEILKETVPDKFEDIPIIDLDEKCNKQTQTMLTMNDLDLYLNMPIIESEVKCESKVSIDSIDLNNSQHFIKSNPDFDEVDSDFYDSHNLSVSEDCKSNRIKQEKPIVFTNEEKEQILESMSNIDNISNVDILSDIDENEEESDNFKCRICGFVSETFTKLLLHIQSHVFNCENCLMEFTQYKSYKKHIDICNKKITVIDENFTCEDCGETFPTESELNVHQKEIAKKLPKVCKYCGVYVKNKKSLASHLKIHENLNMPKKKTLPSQCHVCGKIVVSIQDHIKRHEGFKLTPKKCPYCDKVISRGRYRMHLCIHTGEKRYECQLCMKRFIHYSTYKNHVMAHSGEKSFTCDLCDKKFLLKKYLNLHRVTHFDRCFVCDFCNKTFKNEPNFKVHIRKHKLGKINEKTGIKIDRQRKSQKYECKYCNEVFWMRKLLNEHLITKHTGPKLYECEICSKRFGQSAHLRTHVYLVHIKLKPFKCELCGKAFALKAGVRDHVRLRHQGLTRYHCEICEKGFYYPNKLRKHMSTAHADEM